MILLKIKNSARFYTLKRSGVLHLSYCNGIIFQIHETEYYSHINNSKVIFLYFRFADRTLLAETPVTVAMSPFNTSADDTDALS